MLKEKTREIVTVRFSGAVTETDIHEGECRLANKCMMRVSVERVLRRLDPNMPNHHTRVDGGHIRFNFKGYRWVADTPSLATKRIIQFDEEARDQRVAKKTGKAFVSKVMPFDWTIVARRLSKLKRNSDERRARINEARRQRAAAGQRPKKYTLHERVVGF